MSVDTKELRSFHGWTSRNDSERLDMLRAAADCIESQAAEIERLRGALKKISRIKDRLYGGDWDEIEQAREIAKKGLSGEINA